MKITALEQELVKVKAELAKSQAEIVSIKEQVSQHRPPATAGQIS